MEAFIYEHEVPSLDVGRLTPHIGADRVNQTRRHLRELATALAGRRLVTVTGDDRSKGGVFEILRSVLPHVRGAGIDTRWLNLSTNSEARPALEFFHVLGHGHPPRKDWHEQLPNEMLRLRDFGATGAAEVVGCLRSNDVVMLHDTQTALLVPHLLAPARPIVWHAHIGSDGQTAATDAYWHLFGPALSEADNCIFYRPSYIPEALRPTSVSIPPAIDPSSPKNALLDRRASLWALRHHGEPGSIVRRYAGGPLPPAGGDALLALQVSRWDLLKDMPGVLRAFAAVAFGVPSFHGLVVGTEAQSHNEIVQLDACLAAHAEHPVEIRSRLHVWTVGKSGTHEHDEVIRTVQSAADIVVQKSLREGFGLTITEAMLRGKPVVASRVGAIPDQVRHGVEGLLLDDPSDHDQCATALRTLLEPGLRTRLGRQARHRALALMTIDRQLCAIADVLIEVVRSR